MNAKLKCDCCGRTAEGTIEELSGKGWKRTTRTKNGESKKITECPEHKGVMTGRER